jgi:amino acid adenylation domain-containing protein
MALRDLSQQQQASLFVLFLAAFKVLLHRYTEQDDIVVGSTVRGRTQPGCESLIGCFEQSLPLRTDLSGDPDFSELLSRVNQTTGEGFSNQDFPFEELLKELQVDRDLSQEPLFQVRFQLQVVDTISITPPELKLAVLELETGMTQYDLALGVIEQSQGFHCHFHYNQDLFEAATIARMAGHFQTLLESIVANPEEKISLLPLLTDGERQQLVKEWNEIRVKAQETAFSYELFEAQVSRRPDSPALTFESESLTYRELDQRVNQLAQYLQTLGIRPEVLVGICMERSIELVVSVLAIHKAGGACLPLDPGLPDTRMTFMLEASCSPVILTEEKFLKKLSTLDVRVVCLDTIQGALKQQKKEPPLSELIEQNLSHVFYTSGSTGEPKAVMWNQSKQSKHQTWTQKTFRLTEDDRYLMKSAIGFTPLTSEIFWSLLSGAHLIVAPPGTDQDSRELVRLIAEHQITVIILVPSMLEAILEEPELEKCDSLRQVICFGETLSGELEERFLARFSANLNVIYGVTEAPGATYRICRRGQPYSAVNIGRRLPTRQVYVLDSRLQLTPIGVPGEICIGGESLARGYVNRPDLTAEKFIPNPFGFSPGARIYRTGDRARYLSDGSLEFLGRMDHQVKIRGYRIELAEIESALENHPDVQRAVAVVREERLGEKCLVAYVVLKPAQSHPVSKLRSFLMQKLPDYMIPSAFVILGKLPLTPAGKVDRRALPVPDAGRPELGASYMAPRTPVEEKLTKIWGEVLGVERVGVQDDFFELGGHSLLATQVMSRVRRAFQAEIPLRVLFEVPTVEGLAVAVVEALAEKLDPGEITHLFS